MRIITFEIEGRPRLGVVQAGEVRDVTDLPGIGASLERLLAEPDGLERLAAAAASGGEARPLEGLRCRLPIARPGKILCLGLNYADHAKEGGNSAPDYPAFFMRSATSLVAHLAPIIRPAVSDMLDYEAELAVVIGKRGRHVARSAALDLVAGYACFNDGSLRDFQRKSSQWTMGKNFDATGAFGPWMVTADELPAGAKGLSIESRLNGKVMQSDNTAHMMVDVAAAVALASEVMTLEPGDLLAMGTPAGVGYPRQPPVFMKPGDWIEIEIEGVGTLLNPITDEQP